MGYFGRIQQYSRGPWFREWYAEDNGLEWFYDYKDSSGRKTLLSSNMSYADRENLARLYLSCRRT